MEILTVHIDDFLLTNDIFLTSQLSKVIWLHDPLASNERQAFKRPQDHQTSVKLDDPN